MGEIDLLKRKLEREIKARKAAETILEEKALQLHVANEELRKLNEGLEIKVKARALELTNSEEKYRRLLENMELGLLEVDNHQIIVKAYDWFCDMTGYRQEELLGKNAMEVFFTKETHTGKFTREQSNRKKGQSGVYEMQIKHKDGHLIWVMVSGCPVIDIKGQVIGSLGIHYDVTEQKNLQIELEESKNIASEAQRAEQLFLARMSHEIRTPLNAIIGMSHLLNDTNPSLEQREFLNILSSSSAILKSLISDILDFSKIQAGEIKVQESEFSLHEVLSANHQAVQVQLGESDINVTLQIDPGIKHLIYGDELMLNQILINLLGNARKFTHRGEIKIEAIILQEDERSYDLKFSIIDSGIGISKDKLALIFKDFKQVKNKNEDQFSGTGLGLAITKQLVQLQGGQIEVTSKPKQGSTFSFDLNYKKGNLRNTAIKEKKVNYSNESFNQEKILVVEDNYMNRKYILTLLKKWNLNFEIAKDGLDALRITKVQKFDLIFMDISMPKMNGFEATIGIRKKENPNAQTPIVALSASAFVTIKKKAIQAGMNDFLCKPFDPQSLKNQIFKFVYNKPIVKTATTKSQNKEIKFELPLDNEHLFALYEDNWEFALDMFKLFKAQNLQFFFDIQDLLLKDNFQEARKLAHKLISNFSMVGLLAASNEMRKLESLLIEEKDKTAIILLYDQIAQDIEVAIPVLDRTIDHFEQNFSTSPQTL